MMYAKLIYIDATIEYRDKYYIEYSDKYYEYTVSTVTSIELSKHYRSIMLF